MATKIAVHNEILRLKHILFEELKEKTSNAGIGLTNVSMSPEQELAQKMLVDGRPKAFVEFFDITTTLEPEPTNKEDEEAGIRFPIAEAQRTLKKKEVLSVLGGHLVESELAARIGNFEKLFFALSGVGCLFDETCYFATAIAYYLRALTAAMKVSSTRNTFHIAKAKYNLGQVYWKMHNSIDAINCYEECLPLARFLNDGQLVVLAAKELLEIYWDCAEKSAAVGSYRESIDYFEKCVQMGAACSNPVTGGEAKYNIGLLYGKLGQTQPSVKAQTEYLEFSRSINNKAGECKAHASMSETYEAAGNIGLAVCHLKYYLEAAASFDPVTQAKGHCLLGSLYRRQNERELSLEQFGKYFALARKLKDPDLVDVGRVNIGIVREIKSKQVTLGQCNYWELM